MAPPLPAAAPPARPRMSSDRYPLTRRHMAHVTNHWQPFAGMIVCMVAAGLLQPILPWMLAPLLDAAATHKNYPFPAEWLPYVMLAVIILLAAFSYGRSYLGGWLDATLQRDYRILMGQKLARLPLSRLRADSTGDHTSRFMLFLPQLTGATLPVSMALVQESLKAAGYIALMCYWQWQLTLVVLTVAPIGAGMIALLGKRMKKVAARAQRQTATCQNHLNELIAAAPIVKLAGDRAAADRLSGAFNALRGGILRTHIVLASGQPLTHILIAIPFAIVIAAIVRAIASGDMTAGESASFLTVMLLLPTPIRVIARAMHTWEQMLVAAREIYTFLDTPSEADHGTHPAPRLNGAIEFADVTFAYPPPRGAPDTPDTPPSPPILNRLNLRLEAGETLALVGQSGAGKSTLCALLPRFHRPTAGVIRINDRDINDFTLASLRAQIAIVPQKPLLFDDTIAANVAFPTPPTAQNAARIETALKNAAAWPFTQALSRGIHTRIGENGDTLSGGQQQRLMLARAFYRDSPILILDEPTSAQDAQTEHQLKKAMRRLLTNRTALIITHRHGTIHMADRVAVIADGVIQTTGTPRALAESHPLVRAAATN